MANQTRQLAELLADEGLEVELVQTNTPYRPEWVRAVRGLRALVRLLPYLVVLWRAAGRVRLFHVMANSGWSWHLFAAPAIWIAWLRRRPVVVNYRGGQAAEFFARQWPWLHLSLKRAQAIAVPSTFLATVFGTRGQPVHIVPNIIDLRRFTSVQHGQPGVRRDAAWPHVIVTRNLEPVYDVGTAIHAFAIIRKAHPHARLTVTGGGPERRKLERLAADLGLGPAVDFKGAVPNADMAALYRRADVMLNPSLADNMPISILEALASGVPVVSTDVGGVRHLVAHGEHALLVPAGDSRQMAQAVLEILEDKGLHDRLIANGLTHVHQFQWCAVRERLFEVYRRALSGQGSAIATQPPRG